MAVVSGALRSVVSVVVPVLALAGCMSAPATGGRLDDIRLDQVRSLAMQCYIANRHVINASYSPEVRFACRDWAERQAGIGI